MSGCDERDAVSIIAGAMIDVFGARAEIVAERQFHTACYVAGPASRSWLSIIARIEEHVKSGAHQGDLTVEVGGAEPAQALRMMSSDRGVRGLGMLNQRDIKYYLGREAEERARADTCSNSAVRSIHFELAERYADAVWSLEESLYQPMPSR